jgi:hypothetical protein
MVSLSEGEFDVEVTQYPIDEATLAERSSMQLTTIPPLTMPPSPIMNEWDKTNERHY